MQYLVKKDDYELAQKAGKKPYIYAWTKALALRSDMMPCTDEGILVGVGMGLGRNEADEMITGLQEENRVLKAKLEAALEGPVTSGEPEKVEIKEGLITDKPPETEGLNKVGDDPYAYLDDKPVKKMNKDELVAFGMRKFNVALSPEITNAELMAEIEKLQANKDLQGITS